ncbi:LysE family translocator [Micromonospora endolithica]|uniref:LysE family translocator n=1 Tax=Micromonospora endolithica TaxID=230091 RepID=A0A3A9YP60_9ACTN|nr:LysE family translocator [Micromonospora endolithica]RKN37825.1 LysE family translocator [Micromonospora endolithica]TWJ22160.1 threonine/homoserine/homoserine lactone efflux protein [Micromonospora endolithica]
MTIAFLVTTLVVVLTPGAGVIFTLSAALTGGRRAALVAAFGCTVSIVPHLLAATTGLAALLHSSAVAFGLLKYLGVAYLLLWLAVATLRDRGSLVVADGPPPASATRVFTSAVLLNLLNPKVTVFFVAFLPQFVAPGRPGAVPAMIGLGGVFMLTTLVAFAVYGLCAAAVRRHVLDRPAVTDWLRRGFAGSFLALGLLLARAEA